MMKKNPQTLSKFTAAISIVLVWWLVPITLWTFFWENFLSQSLALIVWQMTLFSFSACGALVFHALCILTLKGKMRKKRKFS